VYCIHARRACVCDIACQERPAADGWHVGWLRQLVGLRASLARRSCVGAACLCVSGGLCVLWLDVQGHDNSSPT
jgi:hypothetical protein